MTRPDSSSPSGKARHRIPPSWDLNRIVVLLKGQLEEIQEQQSSFFGTLKIEINFREGEIETVALERRQTFKD